MTHVLGPVPDTFVALIIVFVVPGVVGAPDITPVPVLILNPAGSGEAP